MRGKRRSEEQMRGAGQVQVQVQGGEGEGEVKGEEGGRRSLRGEGGREGGRCRAAAHFEHP